MTQREYRIVGNYGQWGEILSTLEDAEKDLGYCRDEYQDRDHFVIEVREVGDWQVIDTS